jgi:hypothetical protein
MADLDMHVPGTEKGIEGVRQAVEVIQQAWISGEETTSAVGKQLGLGRMGQAFMGVYNPEADRAAQQVYQLTVGGRDLVAAGRRSVAEYEATDQRIRAAFERLLSPTQLMAWDR